MRYYATPQNRYIEARFVHLAEFIIDGQVIILGADDRDNANRVLDFLYSHPTRPVDEFYRQYEECFPYASQFVTGAEIPIFKIVKIRDRPLPNTHYFETHNPGEFLWIHN